MKTVIGILFALVLCSFVALSTKSVKVTAWKSEEVKLDSMTVKPEAIEVAIEKMSNVKGATFVTVDHN